MKGKKYDVNDAKNTSNDESALQDHLNIQEPVQNDISVPDAAAPRMY